MSFNDLRGGRKKRKLEDCDHVFEREGEVKRRKITASPEREAGTVPRETKSGGRKKRKLEDCDHVFEREGEVKRRKITASPEREAGTVPRETKSAETFISEYLVGKKIGQGGFGSVFEGIRMSDGQQVAIKFVEKTLYDESLLLDGHHEPLPVEIALMLLMSKSPGTPNVIRLLDWFDAPSEYILVLERPIPCKSLNAFLEDYEDGISESAARVILRQVVRGTQQCFKRGVFHRDIKAENVLICTDTMQAKIIDFGCGALLQRSSYKRFAGTYLHRPPEKFLKGTYCATPATVWSLGILLFDMVCGYLPFNNTEEIVHGDLSFKAGLSDECCDLIRWCLHQKPYERPTLSEIFQHEWFEEK